MSEKKYKASKMVKLTERNGEVSYGKPNHLPMEDWGDYTLVPTEEVDESL